MQRTWSANPKQHINAPQLTGRLGEYTSLRQAESQSWRYWKHSESRCREIRRPPGLSSSTWRKT